MSSERRTHWLDYGLALAACALVAAVLLTRQSVTTSEVRDRANNVLEVWRPDTLTRLTLSQGKKSIDLVRKSPSTTEQQWTIHDQGDRVADPEAVSDLLATLNFATWQRTLDTSERDMARLGLASPKAELKLEMGKLSYRIRLGKDAQGSAESTYLEVEGGQGSKPTVGVVKSEVAQGLLVDLRAFRGRTFIALAPSELSKVALSGSGGERRLVHRKHRWWFDNMMKDRLVDDEALDPVLFQFPRIRAETFLDEARAKQALTGETVRIEVTGKKQTKPVVVEVGGHCPDKSDMIVALREGANSLAGCVTSRVLAGLTLRAESLLDHTAFGFTVEEVEAVRIERAGQKLSLKRKESAFVMDAPEHGTVTLDAGNRRVKEIVSSRGEVLDETDRASLGLDPPRGRAVLRGLGKTGTESIQESILLGNVDSQGRLVVERKLDHQLLRFERGQARAFAVDATLLRALRVLDFEPEDLHSISVETRDYDEALERQSTDWVMTRPEHFEADARLANDLAGALAGLTAERWVSDRDDGSFGLSDPRLAIEFALEKSPEKHRRLLVGSAVVGGAYAKLADQHGVFVLPTEALRALDKLVVSRSGFVFHEADLYELRITTEDRKLVLERRGDDWTSPDLPGTEQAGLVVEAALDLRPEVAIHAGGEKASEGFAKPVCTLEFGTGRDPAKRQRTQVTLGASDVWRGSSVHYARSSRTRATFVVEAGRLRKLLDLL